jgi:hypothetical protein
MVPRRTHRGGACPTGESRAKAAIASRMEARAQSRATGRADAMALPPNAVPNSGSPPVKQRSPPCQWSSGPICSADCPPGCNQANLSARALRGKAMVASNRMTARLWLISHIGSSRIFKAPVLAAATLLLSWRREHWGVGLHPQRRCLDSAGRQAGR